MAIKRYMDIAVAPFVALLAFVLFHQKGIGMVADGRAVWEGAVNLVAGNGYSYFSGNPVIAWPPLYSIYLGLWTMFLGPTGWSLLLSNGLLIVLQAFFWNSFMRTIARQSGVSLSTFQSFVLSLFLGLYIALQLRSVLSYNLLYVFMPLYLDVLWRCFRAKGTRVKVEEILLVSLLGTLMLLTHNLAIAFVIAGSAVILLARTRAKWSFVLWTVPWITTLTLGVPVVIWDRVRALFNQTGSHYVGFGAGKDGPFQYAYHLLWGPGRLLMFDKLIFNTLNISIGASILLVTAILYLMYRDRRAVALHFSTLFVLVSSAVLYGMFNMTWIYSALAATTYIMFIPLILCPAAYITAISQKIRWATPIAVAMLVQQLYWTSMWAIGQYTSTLADLDFPKSFASPEAYISSTYRSGPPVRTPLGVLIPSTTEEEPRGRRM